MISVSLGAFQQVLHRAGVHGRAHLSAQDHAREGGRRRGLACTPAQPAGLCLVACGKLEVPSEKLQQDLELLQLAAGHCVAEEASSDLVAAASTGTPHHHRRQSQSIALRPLQDEAQFEPDARAHCDGLGCQNAESRGTHVLGARWQNPGRGALDAGLDITREPPFRPSFFGTHPYPLKLAKTERHAARVLGRRVQRLRVGAFSSPGLGKLRPVSPVKMASISKRRARRSMASCGLAAEMSSLSSSRRNRSK